MKKLMVLGAAALISGITTVAAQEIDTPPNCPRNGNGPQQCERGEFRKMHDGQGPHGQGMRGRKGKHGQQGDKLHNLCRRLELTEEQQTQVKELMEDRRAGSEEIMETVKGLKDELRSLCTSSDFDEAAFRAKSQEIAAIMEDAAVEKAKAMQEVRSLLTPEQQIQLDEMKEQRGKGQGKGMRGRGQGRKGQGGFRGQQNFR